MRIRLRAHQRRRQLLEVAAALFAEHGYHGLSMESLAVAAGVSKPVLYQHFPSKRELYLALVAEAVEEMEGRVRAALEGTTDNKARVAGAIAAYFDFVEDARFRLVFATAELGDAEVREAVDGAFQRVAAEVAGLIAEDAELDRSAALLLATALRGLAAEGARWWLDQPDRKARTGMSKEQAAQLLARIAWRGLGSFGPQAGPVEASEPGDPPSQPRR